MKLRPVPRRLLFLPERMPAPRRSGMPPDSCPAPKKRSATNKLIRLKSMSPPGIDRTQSGPIFRQNPLGAWGSRILQLPTTSEILTARVLRLRNDDLLFFILFSKYADPQLHNIQYLKYSA